ncbi:MAG TPA: M3 family metallopeptidase [Bryobacteraceae bacterium]|nr:peptidase M3 [Bryobacterales bacterium]HRJ19081.1 M3 family metallopeptidase [Bryobacteraceae bacterium]
MFVRNSWGLRSRSWAAVLALGVCGLPAVLPAQSKDAMKDNILLQPWSGPYGGVPPFDKVKIADFKPALEYAMGESLKAIDAIVANPAAPTFENTIEPMERMDEVLNRVQAVYRIWSGNLSSPEFRPVETEMAPKLAAHRDKVFQNAKLFARIEAVYNSPAKSKLTPEQQRLVWDRYTDFVRAGAKLTPEQKKKVAEINQRLATLYTKFSNNLLRDEEHYVLYLKKEQLGGLPSEFVAAAAVAAAERGRKGEYAVLNTRSSMDPFLTYSTERALREKVWRTYYSRGDNNDEFDNKALITEILKLRAERTKLQGYSNFAARAIEKQVAKTPEAAMDLMMKLWPAAIGRVKEEVADMQALAEKEGAKITIEPWDYRFYAEKVRKAKYDLDSNEVKQYLQLDKLREGMFWAATRLFGYEFAPVTDVPVYHPDVRVWRVSREGAHVGLFYFDPYARSGKRSGAWMSAYRGQQKFAGDIKPIVSNNSNFVKAAPGQPVLISWDDAETLFHEFGHALHGLSSNVKYPTQAGTSVARDYVELPSQIYERWLATPQLLNEFARHHETGQAMPKSLLEKIERASKFNQGFATTEFLASALIDMKVHTIADPGSLDPDKFEKETLAALKMPKELPMRHRTPQFAHIFSSEGYAAGYYSYLWADALTADAWEAFLEAKGPYDTEVAKRFFENVLSKGDTMDPAEAYRKFRGRDVDTNALMRDRGFAVQ